MLKYYDISKSDESEIIFQQVKFFLMPEFQFIKVNNLLFFSVYQITLIHDTISYNIHDTI